MPNFTAGTSFTDGVTNDVTALKLNALIADAVPTSSLALNSTTGTIGLFSSGTGTAATPAIQPTGDTNTGIFFPAADTIAFAEGGAEAMRIDSNGNVGIGTTSPTAQVTISKIVNSATLPSTPANHSISLYPPTTTGYYGGGISWSEGSNTAANICAVDDGASGALGIVLSTGNNSAISERLRIDSSGNVGIGTTSPAAKLTVSGTSGTGSELRVVSTTANTAGKITFYESALSCWEINPTFGANGPLVFKDTYNNTERLRITSGGYLKASNTGSYINATAAFHEIRNDSSGNEVLILSHSAATAPYGMQIRFTASPNDITSYFFNCFDGGGTTLRAELRSNGGFRNYQANDGNLSDERLKKDITASPGYLDKICSIPVVNFKYKDQTHDDYNLGVIAQQVEAVCPELVDADGFGETPEDGIPLKSIYQTDLQYALMKCIQELKFENDSLKARIAALEAA